MQYETMSPLADKFLNPDGSVTTASGTGVLPPDTDRAAEYVLRSPMAAKFLLPDGTVVDTLPVSGSGGSGGSSEGSSIPDLSKKEVVLSTPNTLSQSWTADRDGFIQREVEILHPTSAYRTYAPKINGEYYYIRTFGGNVSTGDYTDLSEPIPVKIGDIVTTSIDIGTTPLSAIVRNILYFMPSRPVTVPVENGVSEQHLANVLYNHNTSGTAHLDIRAGFSNANIQTLALSATVLPSSYTTLNDVRTTCFYSISYVVLQTIGGLPPSGITANSTIRVESYSANVFKQILSVINTAGDVYERTTATSSPYAWNPWYKITKSVAV